MSTTETPENHEPAPLLGLGSSDVLGPAVRAAYDAWYAAATFETMGNEWTWAARLAELSAEVRELRAMLAPPSAVILTGAEVAEHFKRLREGGA